MFGQKYFVGFASKFFGYFLCYEKQQITVENSLSENEGFWSVHQVTKTSRNDRIKEIQYKY